MKAKYEPFEEFGNAVVLQAVKDWRDAAQILRRGRKNVKAQLLKKDCEMFFKSPEFNLFSQLDGKVLLKKLEGEVVL